ncbi:MAG: hypothetical protein ACTSRS_13160 [Candidatus Helarchaeota archaeon]
MIGFMDIWYGIEGYAQLITALAITFLICGIIIGILTSETPRQGWPLYYICGAVLAAILILSAILYKLGIAIINWQLVAEYTNLIFSLSQVQTLLQGIVLILIGLTLIGFLTKQPWSLKIGLVVLSLFVLSSFLKPFGIVIIDWDAMGQTFSQFIGGVL